MTQSTIEITFNNDDKTYSTNFINSDLDQHNKFTSAMIRWINIASSELYLKAICRVMIHALIGIANDRADFFTTYDIVKKQILAQRHKDPEQIYDDTQDIRYRIRKLNEDQQFYKPTGLISIQPGGYCRDDNNVVIRDEHGNPTHKQTRVTFNFLSDFICDLEIAENAYNNRPDEEKDHAIGYYMDQIFRKEIRARIKFDGSSNSKDYESVWDMEYRKATEKIKRLQTNLDRYVEAAKPNLTETVIDQNRWNILSPLLMLNSDIVKRYAKNLGMIDPTDTQLDQKQPLLVSHSVASFSLSSSFDESSYPKNLAIDESSSVLNQYETEPSEETEEQPSDNEIHLPISTEIQRVSDQDKKFIFSLFNSEKDKFPKQQDATWFDFLALFENPPIQSKKSGKAFSPVTFNGNRAKANVDLIHIMVFEVDKGLTFNEAIELTRKLDCTFFMYSTYSHTSENNRFRIIIPMTRSITPQEFKILWHIINANIYNHQVDQSTKDQSRLWFLPAKKSEDSPYTTFLCDGEFLDPDLLINAAKTDAKIADEDKDVSQDVCLSKRRITHSRVRIVKEETTINDAMISALTEIQNWNIGKKYYKQWHGDFNHFLKKYSISNTSSADEAWLTYHLYRGWSPDELIEQLPIVSASAASKGSRYMISSVNNAIAHVVANADKNYGRNKADHGVEQPLKVIVEQKLSIRQLGQQKEEQDNIALKLTMDRVLRLKGVSV